MPCTSVGTRCVHKRYVSKSVKKSPLLLQVSMLYFCLHSQRGSRLRREIIEQAYLLLFVWLHAKDKISFQTFHQFFLENKKRDIKLI